MSEELKPCPFCGNKKIDLHIKLTSVGNYFVFCGTEPRYLCGIGPMKKTRDEAIAAWNRRAPSPEIISVCSEHPGFASATCLRCNGAILNALRLHFRAGHCA